MDSLERKKIAVVTKYAVDSFSEGDWLTLGQITGALKEIADHPRLFRAMSFGDGDYESCAAAVIDRILGSDSKLISDVVDYFDIDLWFQQKDPEKYRRLFEETRAAPADFWRDGYLRVFVSHLSSNKERMSYLKAGLARWGISAFIAHEDIQPSRQWRDEVEAGLETMDVLIAVVEPGFRESEWCSQEVGFALGRKIDIVPLQAGADPFGFFGKFQGIRIKGKVPEAVAGEIALTLLRKPKHRSQLLQSMARAFAGLESSRKVNMIRQLDSWSVVTDDQVKVILETSSLSKHEREQLEGLVGRVGAFKVVASVDWGDDDDDIPF